MEFQGWPKTARLNSEVVITEKVDGTNGAVIIEKCNDHWDRVPVDQDALVTFWLDELHWQIGAQSRNRILSVENDNQGFAQWVLNNAKNLYLHLGEGRHFGEWTTKGLQTPKFFLFNTKRWAGLETEFGLSCVPVLYEGPYDGLLVEDTIIALEAHGSYVYGAPPEGIVVYWKADGSMKKAFTKFTPKHKGNV